jgi:hypothetical protein
VASVEGEGFKAGGSGAHGVSCCWSDFPERSTTETQRAQRSSRRGSNDLSPCFFGVLSASVVNPSYRSQICEGRGLVRPSKSRKSKNDKGPIARALCRGCQFDTARHLSALRGRNWHLAFAGCQGFTGPVPPPFWITRYGTDKDLDENDPAGPMKEGSALGERTQPLS